MGSLLGLMHKAIMFLSKIRKNEVQEIKENLAAKKNKRQKIFNKTNGHCAYCGAALTIENMKATCVIPLSRGGSDGVQNKLPACRNCNKKKGNLTHEEFLENRKGQVCGKRQTVYEKTDGHCAYCGTELGKLKNMTLDHIVPLSLDGGNGVNNMFPACLTCNQAKGALTVEQFREKIRQYRAEPEINDKHTHAMRFRILNSETQVIFFFEWFGRAFLTGTEDEKKMKQQMVYDKTDGRCAYCGESIDGLEKMAITFLDPMSSSAHDDINGMLPACRACDKLKGALTLKQFRAARNKAAKEVHIKLMNSNSAYKNAVHMGAVKTQNVAFFFERNNINMKQGQNKEKVSATPELEREHIAMPELHEKYTHLTELREEVVLFLSGGKKLSVSKPEEKIS
jgi:5-methylcytosine-specific restriction endonuclease McrA